VTSAPRAAAGGDESSATADNGGHDSSATADAGGHEFSGTAADGEHDSSGTATTDRAAARQSARMQLMRSGRPQPVRARRQANAARVGRVSARAASERDANEPGDESGDGSGDESEDEAGRAEGDADESGSVASRTESDETPTYEIATPHIDSLIIRVASRSTGETKLVRINMREGIIVDGDECTFKCEEVEE
jgi:hypothetical protein